MTRVDMASPEAVSAEVDAVMAVAPEERAALIAYRLYNAPRLEWPYPHSILTDVLPDDLFRALRALDVAASAPRLHGSATGHLAAEVNRYGIGITPDTVDTDPTLHPLLRYTYKVLSDRLCVTALSRVFGRDLIAFFGRAELPIATTMVMVEDRTGYALLPHTDTPFKAVTLLIYLADDGADPSYGTEMYMPAPGVTLTGSYPMRARFQRERFLRVATAPYRPNGGLMFPPSPKTFHGVREVSEGDRTRRLLQFQLFVNDPAARRVDDDSPAAGQPEADMSEQTAAGQTAATTP